MKNNYIRELIQKINNGNNSNITDHLCECADFFESIAMNKIEIDVHSIENLRESIKNFINNNESKDQISTAVWALGKLANKNEEDYFVDLIRKFIDDNSSILYQSMIALSRIDINMFGSEVGSLFDAERNKLLASEFLKNKSI